MADVTDTARDLTETARDLTKNAFSFSWSLSLFGAQQMVNLLTPSKAADAFRNASHSMQQELDAAFQQAFQAGDTLQRDIVDMTLGGAAGQSLDPRRLVKTLTESLPGRSTPSAAAAPPAARATGWGPIPYPVIPPGPPGTPGPPPAQLPGVETNISPDYPFEPHYVEVHGAKMHYVEVGSGDPILILHGNPTWSYLWRNIIPHLQPLGRCIPPDLIGFGRSDKPDIKYTWSDQVRYLEGFIKKMGLKNVTLVLHDWGSALGFNYAMRNEHNVKALAFFEAIIRPFPWDEFSNPEFRELFRKFRTGDVGGEGWQLIVEQNMFIEQLLPQAAGRPLSETEMDFYREPFREKLSRVPIWRFARSTPIGGEPRDVWHAVSAYSRRLRKTRLPKLLLYAQPGALITEQNLEWAKRNITGLDLVDLGPGSHFLQESSPNRIGSEIAHWISKLPAHCSPCSKR